MFQCGISSLASTYLVHFSTTFCVMYPVTGRTVLYPVSSVGTRNWLGMTVCNVFYDNEGHRLLPNLNNHIRSFMAYILFLTSFELHW